MVRSISRKPALWQAGLALAAGIALTAGPAVAAGKDTPLLKPLHVTLCVFDIQGASGDISR